MSVTEAAKTFGISRDRLYALVKTEPDIPIIHLGEFIKINTPMFEIWLDRITQEGRRL